jgi:hypothetical protein
MMSWRTGEFEGWVLRIGLPRSLHPKLVRDAVG